MGQTHSYKELLVWQKAMDLVVAVYELTEHFPPEEQYGLSAQMRRAAVSIPSNIAEGRLRGHRRDYTHFLITAYSSGGELETQVLITKRLPNMRHLDYAKVDSLLEEVMKMLNSMVNHLRVSAHPENEWSEPKKLVS